MANFADAQATTVAGFIPLSATIGSWSIAGTVLHFPAKAAQTIASSGGGAGGAVARPQVGLVFPRGKT